MRIFIFRSARFFAPRFSTPRFRTLSWALWALPAGLLFTLPAGALPVSYPPVHILAAPAPPLQLAKKQQTRRKFKAATAEEINVYLRRQQPETPLAQRLKEASDAFVGAPYRVSPLGEGAGQDPDPRLRLDAFDCTTFVETSLAMSLAHDLPEARALLDVIRYQSADIRFENRRHFPAAQWLPQLEELGFLKDITRQVAGDETSVEKKVLNAKVWDQRKKPTVLELAPQYIPDGEFLLDVWPLDLARKGQKKIPPGTVLNLVRVNFKRIPVRISHQGLIIEKNGTLYLRHAADRKYHSVVDEPLDRFLARMQHYKKWPVRGIHLSRIQSPENWQKLLKKVPEDSSSEHK